MVASAECEVLNVAYMPNMLCAWFQLLQVFAFSSTTHSSNDTLSGVCLLLAQAWFVNVGAYKHGNYVNSQDSIYFWSSMLQLYWALCKRVLSWSSLYYCNSIIESFLSQWL